MRKAGRFFNPVTLLLAGLCFLLPFATVACNTPGGYGRAAPGGSSTYTGIDLAVGGQPDVTPDKVRPLPPGERDTLPPQPAAIVVLVLVLAAIGFAIRTESPYFRRASVAVLAGVAGTALLVNQALVQAELNVRVSEHLSRTGEKLPAGKTTHDYVQTGQGFGLCLLLLLVILVVNAIGWWRARPRPALVSGDSTQQL